MTAPGWYRGEGDPPGTQRYWDGTRWVGDPVYEPTAAPVGQPPPPPPGGGYAYAAPVSVSTFPTGLKVVAIIVSVMKAIPLALMTIFAIFLAGIGNEFDNEFGDFSGFDDLLDAAAAVLFGVVLIGGLLVGFHFAGAVKERPIMLFVPAVIMSLFDGLLVLGAWSSYADAQNSPFVEESAGGPMFMTGVAAAQIFVAVQAIRANSN